MRGFLIRAVVVALGLWLASQIVPGVEIRSTGTLIAAALLLGVVNAFVRPILVILTLPDHPADARPVPAGHQRPDDRAGVALPRRLRRRRPVAGDPLRRRGRDHELADVRLHRPARPHRSRDGAALRAVRVRNATRRSLRPITRAPHPASPRKRGEEKKGAARLRSPRAGRGRVEGPGEFRSAVALTRPNSPRSARCPG